MRRTVRDILHAKRAATEAHIRELERGGSRAVRYTATIPDMRFLFFGVLCDAGWLIHLAAEITYCARYGFASPLDWLGLLALVCVVTGIGVISYLGSIHEKEIATRLQKNMSFGLTCFGGLAGAGIAVLQMALGAGSCTPLLWVTAGGLLNFAAGMPIFLSFKKGIRYGIR